jgi:hypothetical protein
MDYYNTFIYNFVGRLRNIVEDNNGISNDFKNSKDLKKFLSEDIPEIYMDMAPPIFIKYAKYTYHVIKKHFIWNVPEEIIKYRNKKLDYPISRKESIKYLFSQLIFKTKNEGLNKLIAYVEYDKIKTKYITILNIIDNCGIRFEITTMKNLLSLFYDEKTIRYIFSKKKNTHTYFIKIDNMPVLKQIKYINKNLNITNENMSEDLQYILKKYNIILHEDFSTFYLQSTI